MGGSRSRIGVPKTGRQGGKQIRRIVSSSMARFQNFSYLAALLALVGFIILFTIAYTFTGSMLGFGIMMIFNCQCDAKSFT